MSTAVCLSPSRLPMIPRGGAALEPSVESIVPLPFWSMPRPPAGSVTAPGLVGLTVSVPRGPPPWPTTLMAIVATPCAASDAATNHGPPCLLSPKPWPKTATG